MRRLEAIVRLFVHVSAATLWSVVVTFAALAMLGILPAEQWRNAGKALRDEVAVVEKPRLRELENAKKTLDEQKQQPTYYILEEAVRANQEENSEARREVMAEKVRLALWHYTLFTMQDGMKQDIARWEQQRDALKAMVADSQKQVLSETQKRLKSIYDQMEAADIAQELASRYQIGESKEAAQILATLSDRKAAEVLQEITDSAIRARLISEMTALIASRANIEGITETQK
jgi:flagellar motility protein MotE (MotC chaperone)